MASGFDPYHQWLGIPPAEQPPHHYRLLGLRVFERDPALIEAGFQRAYGAVQPHAAGPWGAAAQAILQRLVMVRQTLLDPQQKNAYDAALQAAGPSSASPPSNTGNPDSPTGGVHKRPAPRPRGEGFPTPAPGGPSAAAGMGTAGMAVGGMGMSAGMASQPLPTPVPPGSVRVVDRGGAGGEPGIAPVHAASTAEDYLEERSNLIPYLLALTAVCVLLGAGTIVVALMGRAKAKPVAQEKPPTAVVPSGSPRGEAPADEPSRLPQPRQPRSTPPGPAVHPELLTERPEFPASAAETTLDDAVAGRTAKPPEAAPPMQPAVEETPAPPVRRARLAALSRALPLPRPGTAAGPIALGKVELHEEEPLELELVGQPGSVGFLLEPTGEPNRWEVRRSAGGEPLGRFSALEGELRYEWLSAADPLLDSRLRNQQVELRAGEEVRRLALREPQEAAPLAANPLKGGSVTTLRVADMPSASALGLEIIALEGAFPTHKFPEGERAEVGRAVHAVLHGTGDLALLAMRVSFTRPQNDTLVIETRPLWDYGGRRVPFAPAQAAAELNRLEAQLKVAENTMGDLRRQFRRSPNELAAAEAAYRAQVQPVEERVFQLKELAEMTRQVQEEGAIHYRVFAKTDGVEVDLVRTKPLEDSPAAESESPASPSETPAAAAQSPAPGTPGSPAPGTPAPGTPAPGTPAPVAVPPGAVPPGSMPPGSMPPGSMPPGTGEPQDLTQPPAPVPAP